MRHLPVADLPQFLGCGNIPLWNRWLEHESLNAYWRAHAVTTQIARVRAPVLQVTGWYDDSRGPIDYTNALSAVPNHPLIRLVIGPGAHQGVDHVAGDFGPESRVDSRQLQLRWFDHYLRGVDNGVDREPGLDYFVIGDNHWHHAAGWPPAHVAATRFFLHSHGHANTSAGDGWIDTLPPGTEPHDEYRYDPSDPTPYLIDSRELETSLNEDFASLNATRPDELVFTSPPLTQPLLVAGPLSSSLYAATDARDTDWYVMLLNVFPDGRAERVQDGVARARFRNGFEPPVAPDAGPARALQDRYVVHRPSLRARTPRAGRRLLGALPEIRPQSQHRWRQRARHDVGRRPPDDPARRGPSVRGHIGIHALMSERPPSISLGGRPHRHSILSYFAGADTALATAVAAFSTNGVNMSSPLDCAVFLSVMSTSTFPSPFSRNASTG